MTSSAFDGIGSIMAQQIITAIFDTRGAADQAVADLGAAGIPLQHIRRVDGRTSSTTTVGGSEIGFFASLKDLFMPEEDRFGYAEGLQRGGYLISVAADEANYARVADILDRDGAINMEEREASWRSEGWTGYAREAETPIGTDTAEVVVSSAAAAIGAVATASESSFGAGDRKMEKPSETSGTATEDDYIPIVEERLDVGKREVSRGRVRLRSYVVERPVQEFVSLHEELVQVDRRLVDRPVTLDEALFAERVIEVEEYGEEAIVSKQARVVEEVGLRKESFDRTETIFDTVRSTKVDVEDARILDTRVAVNSPTQKEISRFGNSVSTAEKHREPIFDFQAEAQRLGVDVGHTNSREEAIRILNILAEDADDLFSTFSEAMVFLGETPLDVDGRNGVDLLMQLGLPSIILRLDDLRFGFQG